MKINSFWSDSPAVSEECTKCGLHKKCKNPFTKVYGYGEMSTLLVMNKPSKREEDNERPWSGHAFTLLDESLASMGIDPRGAFWKCNALQCYTNDIKGQSPASCRPQLLSVINEYKPKHIITVGTFSTEMVLGHLTDKIPGLDGLPFNHIPVHEYNAWVHPLYNPERKGTPNELAYFNRAVRDIITHIKMDEKLEKVDPFEHVECLKRYVDIMDAMEELFELDDPIIAWDVETTGLKPQWEEHVITSVGIAHRNRVFSFPLHHKNGLQGDQLNDVIDIFVDVLEDEKIRKIAHNRKFDELWAEVTLDCTVKGALGCTAIQQHLLDHRTNTKGLKWQAFRRWGVTDYDKQAKRYIEADGKTAKSMNRMFYMPIKEQLLYVGADAYLTLKLDDFQRKEMVDREGKLFPFSLFHEGTDTLKRIEKRGIPASEEYYDGKSDELLHKMDEALDIINSDDAVKTYVKTYNREFKQNSPIALKKVLFDIKKLDKSMAGKTTNNKTSVNEKSLKDLSDPLCDAIINYRKLYKLYNTYMAQFTRSVVYDRIHFNFSLTIPRSYRSSAFDPNLQNIPKHSEYANLVCRAGLLPDDGAGMGEMDFEGMEVSTSATYHKDPNFISYLLNPSSDMHRDNTCDLWFVSPEEVYKGLRYHTKNCWTFPQFYGDWYGSCAPELWKQVITKGNMKLESGEPITQRLRDNNIRNLNDFIEHCSAVEDKMWNKRFKVYTEWKNDINQFYIDNGYVETHMGFRFTGLLDRKQTSNYPIQGTAFHLLLWSLNKIDKWMVENKLRSYICGQIHDSILFIWYPDEIDEIRKKLKQVCTVDIRKEFPWINVPMGIDVELSPLKENGGNFSNIGSFKGV